MMHLAGYCLSVFIGLSLALVGGGGSILTIPVLVFFFNIDPVLATTYSLFIVGITAVSGSINHYRIHNVDYKIVFLFGIPSVVLLLIVRRWLLTLLPQNVFHIGSFVLTKSMLILILFTLIMILAGISMIIKKSYIPKEKQSFSRLIVLGCITGALTGFMGIGGGFIIVPSLVLFASLPMKRAIGTSLTIITINCIVGILGNLDAAVSLNYMFLAAFATFAIVGILSGTWAIRYIADKKLKPVFGWIILGMSVVIVVRIFFGY
jgi:uncharacterized membrane protein YfcA